MITVSIVLEDGLTIPISLDSGASILDLEALDALKVDKTTEINGYLLTDDIELETSDITESNDKNYTTNAEKEVLSNTSGTNTGDETPESIRIKFGVSITNLMDYNPITDGTGNNLTAFQNAIDAANTNGKNLYIPTGLYAIPTGSLLLKDDLTIIGDGVKSQIIYSDNASLFSSTSVDRISIGNLKIKGSGISSGKTFQRLISLENSAHYKIYNILFEDSGGIALYSKLNYTAPNYNSVTGCQFINNKNGLFADERSEYSVTSYCYFSGNDYAVRLTGGNNNLIGCNINNNVTAVMLISGSNDSHGSLVGCNINHNTISIKSTSIKFGFIFSACNIFDGNIELVSSPAITFDGCHFSTTNINLDASNIAITGGSFIASVVLNTAYNGHASILKYANIFDKSTNDWYVLP